MKHLRSLLDLSIEDFHGVLELAASLKKQLLAGERPDLLKNRTAALIFEKASLRTRVSFEAGMAQLGGSALFLTGDVGWRQRESIGDFIKVWLSIATLLFVAPSLRTRSMNWQPTM